VKRKEKLREGRVLLIHQGALGDLILSLPALRVIRETYPRSFICAMGHTERLELLEGRYYADQVVSVEKEGVARLYHEKAEFPDCLANFFSAFDSIFLFARQAHAVFAENLKKVSGGQVASIETFHERGETHVTDYQLSSLDLFTGDSEARLPKLFPSGRDREAADRLWEREGFLENKGPVLAIHAGSGSPKKNWPAERFAALSRGLVSARGCGLILIEGPADTVISREYLRRVEALEPVVVRDRSLTQVAAILKRSDIFVGNDSGITHMAAAVGTSTVAIFGPTDPQVWGPRGPHVRIVRSPQVCAPCSNKAFATCGSKQCMEDISPSEVLHAASDLLKGG
jgi:ADP-heptose:LPS heptosyltransferase